MTGSRTALDRMSGTDPRPSYNDTPDRSPRREFFTCAELADDLASHQADPGLRDDLSILAGDSADDR